VLRAKLKVALGLGDIAMGLEFRKKLNFNYIKNS
jgi:hypothetical protein